MQSDPKYLTNILGKKQKDGKEIQRWGTEEIYMKDSTQQIISKVRW